LRRCLSRYESDEDPALKLVKEYYSNGWPEKKNTPGSVRIFNKFKNDLYVECVLVFVNFKIIVPISLRASMLQLLHESHSGIAKTKARAGQIMYWPGMSSDIEQMIQRCGTCQKYVNANWEKPLMSHEIPDLPFNKIGVDIAEIADKIYFIVVDYYSKVV
jgi:hypothetical protein